MLPILFQFIMFPILYSIWTSRTGCMLDIRSILGVPSRAYFRKTKPSKYACVIPKELGELHRIVRVTAEP